MTVGIVVEKETVAKKMAQALGGREGTYKGTKYVITPLSGHVYELNEPSQQVASDKKERYKSWDLEYLPWNPNDLKWSLKATSGKGAAAARAIKGCDEVAIATDNDPTGEGDLIFMNFALETGAIRGKKVSRMFFVDESLSGLQKAFVERKVIDKPLDYPPYRKALYRSRFDFLSMQFTRVASKCAGTGQMLRNGRLKSAMVVLVGDQLKARAEYKRVPSYTNAFQDENGVRYFHKDAEYYKTKDEVPGGLHSSDVVQDSVKKKTKAPGRLLDLSALGAILAPKGVSADQLIKVYQKMYEDRVLSYPRTEDKTITHGQFEEMLPLVDKIADVVGANKSLLTHRTPRKTHVKDQGAHGANRPGLRVPPSLAKVKEAYGQTGVLIYETLAKNFLAMLAEDYEYDYYTGHVKDYPEYVGHASVMTSPGFTAIFEEEKDEKEDEASTPLGKTAKPFVHEKVPPKPAAPTVGWLMKQLDRRDVGTGATRMGTLNEVTNKKARGTLMNEKKGALSLTPVGEQNYGMLPGTHIGSLDLTADVQANMKAIEKGEKTIDECLALVAGLVMDDMKTMERNAPDMRKKLNVSEVRRYSGTFAPLGKEISFKSTAMGNYDLSDEECEELLKGETIEINPVSAKTGNTYTANISLAEQEYNGRKYWGFDVSFPSGGFPAMWAGHTFTEDEKQKLEAGEEVEVIATSKKGKPFAAVLTYKDEGGSKKINLERFGVPLEMAKYKFSETERDQLRQGETIFCEGFVGRKGKFDASVRFDKEKGNCEFLFDD